MEMKFVQKVTALPIGSQVSHCAMDGSKINIFEGGMITKLFWKA